METGTTTQNMTLKTATFPLSEKAPLKMKLLLLIPPLFFLLSVASVNFTRVAIEPLLFEESNAMAFFGLINVIANIGGTVIQPIGGKFGDLFGRKRVALFMMIPFVLSIVGVSLAKTPLAIGIGFFCLGLTNTVLMPLANGMIIDAFSSGSRTKLLTIMNAVDAAAGMAGPILAGMIADNIGAQNTFRSLTLLVGAAFVMLLLLFPDIRTEKTNIKIDVKGILLMLLTVSPICMALALGGKYIPWASPIPFVLIGASVVFFILFYKVEKKVVQPLVSFELLSVKRFWLILVPMTLHMSVSVLTPFFNIYARQVLGFGGTEIGTMSSLVIISIVCNPLLGIWLAKTGKFRTSFTIAAISMLLAALSYKFVVSPTTPLWLMCVCRAFMFITNCFSMAPVNAYLGICLPSNKRGMGLGIQMFMSSLFGALFAAIFAQVMNVFNADILAAWPVLTTIGVCGAVLRLILSRFIRDPFEMAESMKAI